MPCSQLAKLLHKLFSTCNVLYPLSSTSPSRSRSGAILSRSPVSLCSFPTSVPLLFLGSLSWQSTSNIPLLRHLPLCPPMFCPLVYIYHRSMNYLREGKASYSWVIIVLDSISTNVGWINERTVIKKIFTKINFCYLNTLPEENIMDSYFFKIDKRKGNFCSNKAIFSLNNDSPQGSFK